MKRIVVVGAGLAGLRTAEHLSRMGHTGETVLVGDEPHAPYNRPPLSKEALTTGVDAEQLRLVQNQADGITWRLGSPAVAVGADARTVELADGAVLEADGLVVATGVRPRRVTRGDVPTHVIRTLEDASDLRAALQPGTRVLVLGAGFLGCEIASSAASADALVQVVEPADTPVGPHLGRLVGRELQRRHEARGVTFHLGRTLAGLARGVDGIVATLDDGTHLGVDLVVEAVGCVPDVAWLAGAGLDLTDGLLCDERMRALRADGTAPAGTVVAAGDVARFPITGFDDRPRRIEHWNLAFDTARVAAFSLLDLLGETPASALPPAPVPSFWTEQAGARIDCFGIPSLGIEDCRLLEGDLEGGSALGYHDRSGRLVAVALVDLRRRGPHFRALVSQSLAGAGH